MVILWIVLAILAYIGIGAGLLFWSVYKEPWGGLVMEVWYLIVFLWPLLALNSLFGRRR